MFSLIEIIRNEGEKPVATVVIDAADIEQILGALDSEEYWDNRDELPHDSGYITIGDNEEFAEYLEGLRPEDRDDAQEAWDRVKAGRELQKRLSEILGQLQ
jgi:hypothetical protein